MNENDVIDTVKKAVEKAGSQAAYAGNVGVSPAYLSDIINRRRTLSGEFLAKLGLERVTSYRKHTARRGK
jgi:DNA-binding transcriptional regulator YdaS (Cro superfamily)